MNASPDIKIAFQRHPARPSGFHQIIKDEIGDLLVKMAFVSIRPKIKLQAFEFHAKLVRNVTDPQRGKIWLARFGADAGELRAVKGNLIIPIGIRIWEGLQFF